MRRKFQISQIVNQISRFTSACAEKIKPVIPPGTIRSVHLRVCGENSGNRAASSSFGGSPPRVRRKCKQGWQRLRRYRFTSACAEKICCKILSDGMPAVHLRVCGENLGQMRPNCGVNGSPPRVRRKSGLINQRALRRRFTSACAEKMALPRRLPICRAVHLRVCGENDSIGKRGVNAIGSPPRVRRKSPTSNLCVLPLRFTSACAEKILTFAASPR